MTILVRERKRAINSKKNTQNTRRTKVMKAHLSYVQLFQLKSKILLTVSKQMKPKYTKSSKKPSAKNLC